LVQKRLKAEYPKIKNMANYRVRTSILAMPPISAQIITPDGTWGVKGETPVVLWQPPRHELDLGHHIESRQRMVDRRSEL
jgi:hypothetical protein